MTRSVDHVEAQLRGRPTPGGGRPRRNGAPRSGRRRSAASPLPLRIALRSAASAVRTRREVGRKVAVELPALVDRADDRVECDRLHPEPALAASSRARPSPRRTAGSGRCRRARAAGGGSGSRRVAFAGPSRSHSAHRSRGSPCPRPQGKPTRGRRRSKRSVGLPSIVSKVPVSVGVNSDSLRCCSSASRRSLQWTR